MHFWIDKRSQACGFGRARVSASLSGAGSAGGLGFAHPPRRISGYKSSSSAHPSVHRQQHAQQHHQHHHNHHQHQQHQHLQQSAATHSSGVITTTADCHARNSHQRGIINNNNIANNSSNIYAQQQQQQQPQPIIQQQQQTFVHNMNNNAHLQMQQQQQQQQQQLQSNTCPLNAVNNCSNTSTYNLLNNNNNNTSNVSNSCSTTNTLLPAAAAIPTTNTSSTTTTSTAVLTGAGTIVPVATNIVGAAGRYGRHQYRSNQYPTINMSNQQQAAASAAGQHHAAYDTRSYHHPQFGNMSVRHYQYATNTNAAAVGGDNNSNSNTANITCVNAGGTSSSSSPSLQQMQQNNVRVAAAVANPHPQFSAVATQSGHVMAAAAGTVGVLHDYRGGGNSTGSYMQQPTQQQQHLHSPLHHVCGGIAHAEDLELSSGTTIPMGPMHTRPMHSHHATTHRNMSNGNMRATITHNGIIDDADTQPMITQLRCGMWASLILASVFVAGAKFYFDNQGTGLEVIIFCAFSATFFLAACTVSLCRLPKGLVTARHMAGGNNRGILTNNQSGGGGVIVGPTGITANSRQICGLSNNEHLHELQERTAAAQAGPPPYHIAILLPENSKEVPTVSDESPPPSYDKILI